MSYNNFLRENETTPTQEQNISHYQRICAMESPYPMNYLPYYNPGMAIMVGIMIEKEMLGFR